MIRKAAVAVLLSIGALACAKGTSSGGAAGTPPQPVESLPGHGGIGQDTTPKEQERVVPAEVYIRSYLTLFAPLLPAGAQLTPLAVQNAARSTDLARLFDTWDDYLFELGLPDYRNDLPRAAQTNALMVAAFERLGVALCDSAATHDLRGAPAGQRAVFSFDPPAGAVTAAQFAPLFDQLHRTFLGYPAQLAPTDRTNRFFQLYSSTVARHQAPDAGSFQFNPREAGWAAVCYGLIRHPEFHVY